MADDNRDAIGRLIQRSSELSMHSQSPVSVDQARFSLSSAIRRAVPGVSAARVGELIGEKPKTAADILGRAAEVAGQARGMLNNPKVAQYMLDNLDIKDSMGRDLIVSSEIGVDIPTSKNLRFSSPSTRRRVMRRAQAYAGYLEKNLPQGLSLKGEGFKLLDIAGAPTQRFTVMKGNSTLEIDIPLSQRVARATETGYDVFGKFKPLESRRAMAPGEYMLRGIVRGGERGIGLQEWATGEIRAPAGIRKGALGIGIPQMRERVGELFPVFKPVARATGFKSGLERFRSSYVNIEVPSAMGAREASNELLQMIESGNYFAVKNSGKVMQANAKQNADVMVKTSTGRSVIQVASTDPRRLYHHGTSFNMARDIEKGIRGDKYWFAMDAMKVAEQKRFGPEGVFTRAGRELTPAGTPIPGYNTMKGMAVFSGIEGRMADGEALLKMTQDMQELTRVQHEYTVRVKSEKIDMINRHVSDVMRTGKPIGLEAGALLGQEYSSGKIREAAIAEGVRSELIGAIKGKGGGYYDLTVRETFGLPSHAKAFGLGFKYTMPQLTPAQFSSKISDLGLPSHVSPHLDLAMDMGTLTKQPTFRKQQMVTATMALARRGTKSGAYSAEIQSMLKDPFGFFGGKDLEKEIYKFTQKVGMGAEDVGLIFGSMAEESASKFGFSKKELAEVIKGRAIGVAEFIPSDMPGAIQRGAFEARGLDIMQHTEWGRMLAEDISKQRLIAGQPARSELSRALAMMAGRPPATVVGKEAVTEAVKISDIMAAGKFKNIQKLSESLASGGMLVDVGGDVKGLGRYMYMPSAGEISGMRAFEMAETGEVRPSTLLKNYRDVMASIQEGKDAGKRVQALQRELQRTVVTGVTGKVALPGSSFGQIMASTYRSDYDKFLRSRGTHAIGIAAEDVGQMYADLERLGYDKKYVNQQQAQFTAHKKAMEKYVQSGHQAHLLEKSEQIALRKGAVGVMWRHPQEGPYSATPVKMYYDPLAGMEGRPRITLQEEFMRAVVGGKEMQVATGYLPGMAADFDKDTATVALVNNKRTEKSLLNMMKNDAITSEYIENNIMRGLAFQESKVVSAEAVALTEAEEVVSGAIKMNLQGEVGGVSEAMLRLRYGAMHRAHQTGDKQLVKDMMLLGYQVSQEAISGKHMTAAQARQAQEIGQRLIGAVAEKDLGAIVSEVGGIFDIETLGAGIDVELGAGKAVRKATVRMDVERVIEESLQGWRQIEASRDPLDVMRMMGRGKPITERQWSTLGQPKDFLRAFFGAEKADDYRVNIFPEPTGVQAPKVSMSTGAMIESAVDDSIDMVTNPTVQKAMGEATDIPLATPSYMQRNFGFSRRQVGVGMVGIGIAAAGAMLYASSDQGTSVDIPDSQISPNAGMQVNTGLSDLMLIPRDPIVTPEHVQGTGGNLPQGPQGIETPKTMINTDKTQMTNVVSIRAKEVYSSDYNAFSKRLSERLPNASSVTVNINDNSKTLTPREMQGIIEGY